MEAFRCRLKIYAHFNKEALIFSLIKSILAMTSQTQNAKNIYDAHKHDVCAL